MVDLWDWALVRGTKKDGKTEVSRLVGRLRKRSSKLHPSVPSGGGILKTAAVCEVHLDMVRVTSGLPVVPFAFYYMHWLLCMICSRICFESFDKYSLKPPRVVTFNVFIGVYLLSLSHWYLFIIVM